MKNLVVVVLLSLSVSFLSANDAKITKGTMFLDVCMYDRGEKINKDPFSEQNIKSTKNRYGNQCYEYYSVAPSESVHFSMDEVDIANMFNQRDKTFQMLYISKLRVPEELIVDGKIILNMIPESSAYEWKIASNYRGKTNTDFIMIINGKPIIDLTKVKLNIPEDNIMDIRFVFLLNPGGGISNTEGIKAVNEKIFSQIKLSFQEDKRGSKPIDIKSSQFFIEE